ncbi:lysozyme inhibitor LprI family protein [Paradesertivirga mongoliensis]|uniref:Lysozyme inhibitor LprI family protein n=1 Tax=Paradesertivirga mongoliensis TaxID=2100740 RepID=A0ABW4ZPY5_9SPHI|nr:lysozyme inhibitor LprI family protein [Pedobacter mongoliensis]
MKYFLILVALLLSSTGYSQQKGPTDIRPEIEAKIRVLVSKSAAKFNDRLKKQNLNTDEIEFKLDTFEINHYMSESLKVDYSTLGMRKAVHQAAEAYDNLLNKYYKKLNQKLKPGDKAALLTAQRAWLTYRDAELSFKGTLGKSHYSGGGTIETLIQSSFYLDMIKKRVVELFEHYGSIGRGIH